MGDLSESQLSFKAATPESHLYFQQSFVLFHWKYTVYFTAIPIQLYCR